MSQSLEIASVEIYLCDKVNKNGFRRDITVSQSIDIASGEISLGHR